MRGHGVRLREPEIPLKVEVRSSRHRKDSSRYVFRFIRREKGDEVGYLLGLPQS